MQGMIGYQETLLLLLLLFHRGGISLPAIIALLAIIEFIAINFIAIIASELCVMTDICCSDTSR
jgi:hypothetical protein